MAVPEIRVQAVGRGNWDDLAKLFEARGGPHYCWCSSYRWSPKEASTKADKKSKLEQLVSDSVPVGVLAYDGDQPVGWCSVAPRETYGRIERSRSMPRLTDPDAATWTIPCLFVAREYRGRDVTRALLDGALEYAREEGAEIVEGYPFDSAGISATHRGHSKMFKDAGFKQDGNRWYVEL